MSFLEFSDALDAGEWGRAHEYFLESIRPDMLRASWVALAEYAGLLLSAVQYLPLLEVAEKMKPQGGPLPTAERLSPILRKYGYSVHDKASEVIALLYELYRQDTPKSQA